MRERRVDRFKTWPPLLGLLGLALFVLATAYTFWALDQVVAATEERKQMRTNLLNIERVLSALKDVETGQRGFLLSRDPGYLVPYDQGRASLTLLLPKLSQRLRADLETGQIDRIRAHIETRIQVAAELIDFVRSGQLTPARQEAGLRRGKVIMDMVRAEFADLESEIEQRLLALDVRVARVQQRAWLMGIALMACAALLLVLSYALLLGEQRRRLRVERALGETAVAEASARAQAESQRHIVDILESLLDGFVALNRDWRYTYVNAQAGRMFGRDPASLIGKAIWAEFPEGRDQPFAQAYRRVMESQRAETLEEYYPPWARWFENRIYPTPEGIAIYFHEITDRKRAEAEAQARSLELDTVFEALPDLFFRLRQDGAILDYRARHDDLYLAPKHFLGQRMQDVLPPDVATRFAAGLERLRHESGLQAFEYPLAMPDGLHHYEARLSRLPGQDDLIVVVRDVTDRVETDRALRQARDDLRAFAGRLDHDIESERRRLAREVHDQIGQIFTALKINWAPLRPAAGLDEARLATIDGLLDDGIRVARRIAADLRPPMLDDLGLGPALAHFGELLGRQSGFSVTTDIAADRRLDAEQVNQLFRIAQEALTNIVRHAGARHVVVTGCVEDGHYRLSVEDDGQGRLAGMASGQGMLGMRERAAMIDAELRLDDLPSGGLRLTARVPLIEREDGHAHSDGG